MIKITPIALTEKKYEENKNDYETEYSINFNKKEWSQPNCKSSTKSIFNTDGNYSMYNNYKKFKNDTSGSKVTYTKNNFKTEKDAVLKTPIPL